MKTLFILVLLTVVNCSYSQKTSFKLAIGDQAATIYPFTRIFDKKFYPVVQTGIEYKYTEKGNFNFSQDIVIQYKYHPYLGHSFGIFSQAAGSYRFRIPFFALLGFGVGILGEFPADNAYKLNLKNEYVKVRPMHPMAGASMSFIIGYEFKNRFSIFSSYQYGIQFPFNKTIAILPTEMVFLGTKIKLFKKRDDERP